MDSAFCTLGEAFKLSGYHDEAAFLRVLTRLCGEGVVPASGIKNGIGQQRVEILPLNFDERRLSFFLAYPVCCQYDKSVIICRSGLRGFPTTLPDFQRVFPDDAACAAYLERLRWPDGFTCPKCKKLDEPYRFAKRTSVVLRCRACHVNTSLTATTVMQSSRMPLSVWFWGAYLVTTQTPGQSALQFQRQLGLKRYETAFQMLHKLRAGLVRPERDTIGDQYPVEVDKSFVGGRTKGEGRGVHHKAIVIGAIEVRPRKAPVKGARRTFYAGRLRLRLVPNREAKSLTKFVRENVAKGAVVHTDGWTGYDDLEALGYVHKPLVIDGDPEKSKPIFR